MDKIWILERDESIQCQQLSSEYLEEAVKMMGNAFYQHETVCRALGIPGDLDTIEELNELTRAAAKDGLTVIAIDKKNNKVVGAAFNKLQVKHASQETSFFETFAKTCKQPRSKAIIQLMSDVDSMCSLFELCQTNSLLEIMFLGTLPEYRGKGIGKKLCEISIELAKKLKEGINVKVPVNGQKLDLEPVPRAVSAIFTSFITQKIGKDLGFQIAAEKNYEKFEYDGKTFASVIGNETQGLTLEYIKLN